MSDEADSEDNVEATHIDQVMHHKHPVVKLVREQIKNVEDPSFGGKDGTDVDGITSDGTATGGTSADGTFTSGGGRGGSGRENGQDDARDGQDNQSRRGSLGSRAWEKRGYCASSMMLLALIWLVLIYGAFIGANLCGSLSFKHKLCSRCGIGLGMGSGYSEAEQLYSRGIY